MTTVTRRNVTDVLKKAPAKLWQAHRQRLSETSMRSSVAAAAAAAAPRGGQETPPWASDAAQQLSRREQLQTLTHSKYAVKPVRDTVLPLFGHSMRSVGCVWPLYKPPYIDGVNDFVQKQLERCGSAIDVGAAATAAADGGAGGGDEDVFRAADKTELPYAMALAYALSQRWNFAPAVELPSDMSGIVPVTFFDRDAAMHHHHHVSLKTFEAVFEGHVQRSELPRRNEIISKISIARHGYYLQEPVTVVRWEQLQKEHEHADDDVVDASAADFVARVFGDRSLRLVGDEASEFTRKFDVPAPMAVLRAVDLVFFGKSKHLALSWSPYAREEVIASSPSSRRFAKGARQASLTDGLWTP